ncbi:DUF397 domain-containing protein [Streptomyces sp. NPDC051018]|uniref:DUF397 domain-containing protein n=1 Tax=Streptomyces sp. NPDC051018 TaxID=3365639 RepID=UPI00379C3CF8
MSAELNLPRTAWVKSSYSGDGGGNCVEWAPSHAQAHGLVPVRDSKVTDGPVLLLSPRSWGDLVGYARGSGM